MSDHEPKFRGYDPRFDYQDSRTFVGRKWDSLKPWQKVVAIAAPVGLVASAIVALDADPEAGSPTEKQTPTTITLSPEQARDREIADQEVREAEREWLENQGVIAPDDPSDTSESR